MYTEKADPLNPLDGPTPNIRDVVMKTLTETLGRAERKGRICHRCVAHVK